MVIHIGNNSGHIEQTHSRFPKCLCMFDTQMLIKLASLIICSINGNLTNTSSTPPLEVKKSSKTLYSTFINFVYLNRNFHLLEN